MHYNSDYVDDLKEELDRLREALKDIQKEAMTLRPPRHTWYYDRAQNALTNSTEPLVRDGIAASDKRNPDYPSSDWDKCDHDWKFVLHSEYEDDVRCVKCSAPGRRERDGSVYWPTT